MLCSSLPGWSNANQNVVVTLCDGPAPPRNSTTACYVASWLGWDRLHMWLHRIKDTELRQLKWRSKSYKASSPFPYYEINPLFNSSQGQIQDFGKGGGGGVWVAVITPETRCIRAHASAVFSPLYEVWGSPLNPLLLALYPVAV